MALEKIADTRDNGQYRIRTGMFRQTVISSFLVRVSDCGSRDTQIIRYAQERFAQGEIVVGVRDVDRDEVHILVNPKKVRIRSIRRQMNGESREISFNDNDFRFNTSNFPIFLEDVTRADMFGERLDNHRRFNLTYHSPDSGRFRGYFMSLQKLLPRHRVFAL